MSCHRSPENTPRVFPTCAPRDTTSKSSTAITRPESSHMNGSRNHMKKQKRDGWRELHKLAIKLEDRATELRQEAGFFALEWMEHDGDEESHDLAVELSTRASAYVEIVEMIREVCEVD